MARINNENAVSMTRSATSQGVPMEGIKFSMENGNPNRRTLKEIGNLVGGPHQPCHVSKRSLPDKVNIDSRNNSGSFIGHRPITRRFAASQANQNQPIYQDPVQFERQKRAATGPASSNSFLNLNSNSISNSIEETECRNTIEDLPLPMVSEMEVTGNSELKEIEMEDITDNDDDEIIPDIDGPDSSNPLAVVEYIEEIYDFYRKTEDLSCVSPNYMSNQFDINEKMRAILIDWLIEVHYKLELLDETLYLTVNIIDRFLAVQSVVRKKLQLVGVTAMLLACKYEEVTVPVVEDLILICDRAYTRAEVLEMERLIVNTLQFNMSVPTPYVFMRRFLKAAQSDKKLELLSFFIIELCLVEYEMLKFRPSELAAAAVYAAQCTLNGCRNWNSCCQFHTRYSENQLGECAKMMVGFHQRAGQGKLTGVQRKYSTFKYGCAAKFEPALFLL